MTALFVGLVLAIAIGLLARCSGLDRDRAFYPTVTMVVASYYVLFAAMGASTRTLVAEALAGAVFLVFAIIGFRSSLWVVAIALAAHGVFDFVHGQLISNPGVPGFWPPFCAAYDVTAAVFLAWLLKTARVRAAAR